MSNIDVVAKRLKRYSFSEKMRIVYENSTKIIGKNFCFSYDKSKGNALPWHLETFTMLSIKASPEYDNRNFIGKSIFAFNRMINLINSHTPKRLLTIEDAYLYLSSIGIQQFEEEESPKYRLYRYMYIFDYRDEQIDMFKLFKEYFDCEYCEFVQLFIILMVVITNGTIIDLNKVLASLYKKYYKVFNKLSISVDEYKKMLEELTKNDEDLVNCYCPSATYPFLINEEDIYLPLPHLLSKVFTSSTLYRLTKNNDHLRELIGKNVLESYAYELMCDANIYSEVYREKIYYKERKQQAKTVDVMAKEGENYLFLDSKSYVPLSGLRLMNEDDYNISIERIAKYGEQMYRHIVYDRCNYKEYNQFKNEISKISKERFYGLIVVLEDSYINRRVIYEKIAKNVGINKESEEYNWLISHIKIVDYYTLEVHCIHGLSIIESIIDIDDPYSLSIRSKHNRKAVNEKFIGKINKVFSDATNLVKEIY